MKNNTYTIQKNESGERFVKLANGQIIPADIAGLCAGRDAWISQIQCKCRDCGERFPLSQLHGGGQWCEPCQTAGIIEE
jgi:hypothetical protein